MFTTNNRMEMTAVLEGLDALNEPCAVALEIDSQYVKNGVTRWMAGWKRKGWKTASGEPVKNEDLWLKLDKALAPPHGCLAVGERTRGPRRQQPLRRAGERGGPARFAPADSG